MKKKNIVNIYLITFLNLFFWTNTIGQTNSVLPVNEKELFKLIKKRPSSEACIFYLSKFFEGKYNKKVKKIGEKVIWGDINNAYLYNKKTDKYQTNLIRFIEFFPISDKSKKAKWLLDNHKYAEAKKKISKLDFLSKIKFYNTKKDVLGISFYDSEMRKSLEKKINEVKIKMILKEKEFILSESEWTKASIFIKGVFDENKEFARLNLIKIEKSFIGRSDLNSLIELKDNFLDETKSLALKRIKFLENRRLEERKKNWQKSIAGKHYSYLKNKSYCKINNINNIAYYSEKENLLQDKIIKLAKNKGVIANETNYGTIEYNSISELSDEMIKAKSTFETAKAQRINIFLKQIDNIYIISEDEDLHDSYINLSSFFFYYKNFINGISNKEELEIIKPLVIEFDNLTHKIFPHLYSISILRNESIALKKEKILEKYHLRINELKTEEQNLKELISFNHTSFFLPSPNKFLLESCECQYNNSIKFSPYKYLYGFIEAVYKYDYEKLQENYNALVKENKDFKSITQNRLGNVWNWGCPQIEKACMHLINNIEPISLYIYSFQSDKRNYDREKEERRIRQQQSYEEPSRPRFFETLDRVIGGYIDVASDAVQSLDRVTGNDNNYVSEEEYQEQKRYESLPCFTKISEMKNLFSDYIIYRLKCKNGKEESVSYNPKLNVPYYTGSIFGGHRNTLNEAGTYVCDCN